MTTFCTDIMRFNRFTTMRTGGYCRNNRLIMCSSFISSGLWCLSLWYSHFFSLFLTILNSFILLYIYKLNIHIITRLTTLFLAGYVSRILKPPLSLSIYQIELHSWFWDINSADLNHLRKFDQKPDQRLLPFVLLNCFQSRWCSRASSVIIFCVGG